MADTKPDLEETVDEFFAASEAGDWKRAGKVIAEHAVLWQNADGVEHRFIDALPRLSRMYAALGPWTYSDVRRVVGPDAVLRTAHRDVLPPRRSRRDRGRLRRAPLR